MSYIHLQTIIQAPIERCFDLSRSIDLHLISTEHTQEKVIGGRASGLIKLGETVTWQAVHLGLQQRMTTKITELDSPSFFADEMVVGPFRYLRHEHWFEEEAKGTRMIDFMEFRSPFGVLGQLVNSLYLRNYLKELLKKRNEVIKAYAESERWKELLP